MNDNPFAALRLGQRIAATKMVTGDEIIATGRTKVLVSPLAIEGRPLDGV